MLTKSILFGIGSKDNKRGCLDFIKRIHFLIRDKCPGIFCFRFYKLEVDLSCTRDEFVWRSTPEEADPAPEIPPRSEAEDHGKLPFQKPRESMSRITILFNKTQSIEP